MPVNTLTMTMAELYGNNEVLESTFKGALMPSVFRDDILKKTKENIKTMIFFENKLNDNENVLETKVERNRIWIMLKENVSQVQDIFDNISKEVDYISFSTEYKLNTILKQNDYNFESFIIESFKAGAITGIKDIDKYINKNNELCNKDHIAYIFINNDMRTLYIIRDSKGHRMCKVY